MQQASLPQQAAQVLFGLVDLSECSFELVVGKYCIPDAAFGRHAEEGATWEDNSEAPGVKGHRLDHVLDPGEGGALARREAAEVPAEAMRLTEMLAPLLQGEGRIGDA